MRRAAKWIGWMLAILVGLPVLLILVVLIGANTEPGRHAIERLTPALVGVVFLRESLGVAQIAAIILVAGGIVLLSAGRS